MKTTANSFQRQVQFLILINTSICLYDCTIQPRAGELWTYMVYTSYIFLGASKPIAIQFFIHLYNYQPVRFQLRCILTPTCIGTQAIFGRILLLEDPTPQPIRFRIIMKPDLTYYKVLVNFQPYCIKTWAYMVYTSYIFLRGFHPYVTQPFDQFASKLLPTQILQIISITSKFPLV